MKQVSAFLLFLAAIFLSGCGFVHDEHIIGPYRLVAVDIDEQMSISYDLGNGSYIGRVDQTVFSYGFDDRYIVAMQHPDGDMAVTNYYFLDMTKDSEYANPEVSVTGPLSHPEFQVASAQLGLPVFTRTVDHLK